MSMQEIKRFWAEVSSNPTLNAALAALPGGAASKQLAALAQKHGFQVTAEDVAQYQADAGEMAEDALEAVAGGGDMHPQDPIEPVEDPLQYPPPPTDPLLPPPPGGGAGH